MTPDVLQFGNRDPETARLGREHDGIYCARGGSADYPEGIHGAPRHELGDGFQHTDLECAPRPAARQH